MGYIVRKVVLSKPFASLRAETQDVQRLTMDIPQSLRFIGTTL
jgi:hypothetical protein